MKSKNTLETIEQLMQERGWSVYKLAKESNIPYSSLSNLFKRTTEPTLSTLRKLCQGLGITLAEFFDDDADTPIRIEYCQDERELIAVFQSLSSHDKKLLTSYALGLAKKLPDSQ